MSWVRGQTATLRDDAASVHLRNYAVVATGFPKSARSPHEIKSYFESVLGFEVEGAAVAYDFAEEHTFVLDRLNHLLEKADVELGVYASDLASQQRVNESQDGHVLDCILNAGAAFVVFERESDREFCLRRFHEIELQQVALGRTGMKKGSQTGEGVHDVEPADEDAAIPQGAAKTRNVLFRGKYRVAVSPAPEASSVLWHNFRTGARGGKLVQLAIAWLFAFVAVVAVGSVVFAPAVLYTLSLTNLRKESVLQSQWLLGEMERAIVSLSITIFNRAADGGLQQVVRATGFLQQPHQDSVALVVSCSIVALQLFFFLAVAAIVADLEHMILIPELCAAEIFQLLWMSMLVSEILYGALPSSEYWRAYYAVRRSRYVSVREAEQLLASTPFPLVTGYVDAIQHLLLFAALIAANPASSYALAGAVLLILHSVYAYFAQKYRFLRTHRHHYCTSPKMDLTAQYGLVCPLAVFAYIPIRAALSVLDTYTAFALGVLNLLLLIGIVRVSHAKPPPREWTDIPYVEVAARVPWNYFNTNPVHVLRCVHFPSIVVPPVYPYAPGKEYMQGGMFADYDDAVRLQETLMLLVKNPLKDVNRGAPGGLE